MSLCLCGNFSARPDKALLFRNLLINHPAVRTGIELYSLSFLGRIKVFLVVQRNPDNLIDHGHLVELLQHLATLLGVHDISGRLQKFVNFGITESGPVEDAMPGYFIPGMGKLAFEAVTTRDYNVIMEPKSSKDCKIKKLSVKLTVS